MLLGCYRRSEAVNPDIYTAAIACVLADYTEDIIFEATHPRTGIQASERFRAFPPNSGEVKGFCDDLAARNARHAHYASLPRPVWTPRLDFKDETPGRLANLFVGQDKPGFAAMCEGAKAADEKYWCWFRDHPKWGSGIKVPANWYCEFDGTNIARTWKTFTDDDLCARYQPRKEAAE